MDFTNFYIYLLLGILLIVCIAAVLLLMIIGIVKMKRKVLISAFIPIVIFFAVSFAVECADNAAIKKFEQIPCLAVNDNTLTILNESTGQKGLLFRYILAEEGSDGAITVMGNEKSNLDGNYYNAVSGILSQTDQINYKNHATVKSGFKFTANKSGTAYVCVLKEEYGNPVYVDIYKVIVDNSLNITTENQHHILCDDGFEKNLPEGFAFVTEMVNEEKSR